MYLDYNLDIGTNSVWKIAHYASDIGHFPFSINESGVFFAKEQYYTRRHEKNDYLILYTVSGAGELSYLDRLWMLAEGSAVMIDCNRAHSYRTASENGWTFYWMHVSCESGPLYYGLIQKQGGPVVDAGVDYELIDCFKSTFALMDYVNEISCCLLSHYAASILTKLATGKLAPAAEKPAQELAVQKAVDYIQKNYMKTLNIDDLSKQLNISKFYLIKLFSKSIGVTPYRYLIVYRIGEAKKLLRATHYKVDDIARAVGFADESNFCRTFSRLTGMTPAHYRKEE